MYLLLSTSIAERKSFINAGVDLEEAVVEFGEERKRMGESRRLAVRAGWQHQYILLLMKW